MNNRQLFQISKYVVNEGFLLSSKVINNAENINRKLEKNPNYLKYQKLLFKIFLGILLLLLILYPIKIFTEIEGASASSINKSWIIFSGSLHYSFFFIFQMIFVVTLGLYYSNKIISKDLIGLLNSLPLSQKELSKIIYFSVIRIFDLQFLIVIIGLPFGFLFVAKDNILFVLFSLIVSLIHCFFYFSIFIIICEKTNMFIDSHKHYTRIILNLLFSFSGVFIFPSLRIFPINLSSNYPFSFSSLEFASNIFYLIPFPLNSSSILMGIQISDFSTLNLIFAILGLILSILISLKLFKYSLNIIQKNIFSDNINKNEEKKCETFEIEIKNPAISKVYQSEEKFFLTKKHAQTYIVFCINLLVSVLLSIIFVIINMNSIENGNFFAISAVFSSLFFGGFLLIYGLFNKSNYRNLYVTLPIQNSKRLKAKITVFLKNITLIIIFPILFNVINFKNNVESLLLMCMFFPFVIELLISLIIIKIWLFGKNHKLSLIEEEINHSERLLKWGTIILITCLFYYISIELFNIVYNFSELGLAFGIFSFIDIFLFFVLKKILRNID